MGCNTSHHRFLFTEQQAASSRQVVCLCPDLHYLVIFPHYLFRRGGTDVDRLVHRSVIPGKEIDRVESIPVAVPVIFTPCMYRVCPGREVKLRFSTFVRLS